MEQVLVTGFPGFLAERLVARCQRERGKVFWHFVVLQEEVAGASRKLQALGLPLSECALYPGDVTKPDLGLSTEDADTLRQSVERCFHFAALDDLTASPALSDAVNVWGARRVIAFLKQCPNLRKFNFVSTCYVSGLIEGDVREDELVSPPGFRNEYERTKYEAEAVVRESMGELPTTIFRPAAVVGDSQTGDTSKFDGPYTLILFFRWAHRLSYWMPNLGFGDAHFNCVPVDFVTEVLARVGFSEHYPGATLHVADPVPPTTSEAFALIYQQITGRTCIELKDATKRLVLRVLRYFPVDLVTGIPAQTLDYFEHRGNYATRNLENACEEFDIAIPKWSEFYKPVIKFALTEDRHMPNAAVVREFKAWCMGFRLIYAALGLLLIFAPRFVTGVVTLLDDQAVAADLMRDQLFWQPLGVSLLAVLFVTVLSLEHNPFQKPLHILIITSKLFSTALYIAFACSTGAVSLFLCGLIDGTIAAFHLLFYHRLLRVRDMAGGEFLWKPYYLLFTERFIADFAESMAPDLDGALDMREVVENVREHVRGFPLPNRYAFVACCYYTMLIMPCLYGFMPYFMMNRERRNQFLRRVQHGRTLWTRLPLLFIKMVCAMYLFGQTSYLRSVGAR